MYFPFALLPKTGLLQTPCFGVIALIHIIQNVMEYTHL
jgi:hypothetical protein